MTYRSAAETIAALDFEDRKSCRCRVETPQKRRLNLPQFSAAAGLPGRAPGDRRRVVTDASP
ncbi:hypothetical protein, partial [Aurantimonas coralicida]|uniref:hypothetical protein n=1 Tax=Aurantimonas coralicida TaxID=182270 RepID=UPI001D1970CD